MSPSGFTVNEIRRFIAMLATNKNIAYIHLCESAPNIENTIETRQVGKMLTYFITDFIQS